jgi:CDP-diacylglycerol--glycerol-3-phosphate 3-phosphatidyltransferase
MARFDLTKIKKINFRLLRQIPAEHKRITIPTVFTLLRIALVPIIVGAMVMQHWGIAFSLFMVASCSDMLDGYLARMRNERTFLGACLDPIADKLLLLACFFTLAFVQSPLFVIPRWFVWFVLCKELLLVAGVVWVLIYKGYLEIVQPTMLGKLTTVAQIGFIMWLFACYFFAWVPIKTYYISLGILFVLVGASFVQYARIGLRILSKK